MLTLRTKWACVYVSAVAVLSTGTPPSRADYPFTSVGARDHIERIRQRVNSFEEMSDIRSDTCGPDSLAIEDIEVRWLAQPAAQNAWTKIDSLLLPPDNPRPTEPVTPTTLVLDTWRFGRLVAETAPPKRSDFVFVSVVPITR